MLYTHTLTQAGCYWQGPSWPWLEQYTAQTLCGGGGGEGVDYDEQQRNMANSGFLRIKQLKTTWTF